MKEALIIFRAGLVLAMSFLATNAPAIGSGQFTADEIIGKAVERAKNHQSEQSTFAFTKKTVREERDARGEVKELKEQSDQVIFRNGSFFKDPEALRNGSVNISDDGLSAWDSGKPGKRKDYLDLLTPELVGKYIFSLISRTNANGRSVYEIGFRPKAQKLPANDLKERVLNKAAGTLYIDDSEFELVRAQVSMDSEIPVGGFLGALKRAAFSLERVRLEGGIWFERLYKTDYETRKLAQVKRVITRSECANFRRIDNG